MYPGAHPGVHMNGQPENIYNDLEKSVDAIIEKVGKDIVFASVIVFACCDSLPSLVAF